LCQRKKKEENDRWENVVSKTRSEKDIWEIVNRGRKKKIIVNEEIEAEEWRGYFMELLGGIEYRIVGETERERKGRMERTRKE